MKREILFKAQRTDGKGWVFGVLITCPTEIWILPIGWELSITLEKVEVLPDTVCQYTGLKDKNGVKIFEGDVLFINRIGDYPIAQEHHIIYNNDFATFATNLDRTFDWMRYEGKFEVTGNIHDND
jgi:hypothetical protein